jgi:hypothetical protein
MEPRERRLGRRIGRTMGPLARLVRDESGGIVDNTFTTAIGWYVVFGMFLMFMQYAQIAHQRDVIDHAASVGGDELMKTLCANPMDYGETPLGAYVGARATAVQSAVEPLLDLVAPKGACQVAAMPADVTEQPTAVSPETGARPMGLEIRCKIPCKIPFAAQMMWMCDGREDVINTSVTLSAKHTVVAMGCDSGGTG